MHLVGVACKRTGPLWRKEEAAIKHMGPEFLLPYDGN
jgi:hypothetical protein